MSKYCSPVVVVLAAAAMLIAAPASEARGVQQPEIVRGAQQPEIASTIGVASGFTGSARAAGCWVAPCPSPKPQRECGTVSNGTTWVVAVLRVPCGTARRLVLRLSRGGPNSGLPGWKCHRSGFVQGHCEDSSSPKGKVRAIFYWLDEGGGEQQPQEPRRDWRSVIFQVKDPDTNKIGATARIRWAIRSQSRPGGGTLRTLEYYGKVTDHAGDGHHARVLRVGSGFASVEVARADFGTTTAFGSRSDPIETSLPSYFVLCLYEQDSSIACTDRFRDAKRLSGARRRWTCNSDWMTRVSTVGRGRKFVAHIRPTEKARWEGHSRAAQRAMWRAFEACVRLHRHDKFGLNAVQLHMLRLQLDCHAFFASGDKRTGGTNLVSGGPTWDLEANTPKMSARKLYWKAWCDTQGGSSRISS